VCHVSVVDFFIRHVDVEEFAGKRVLEVGSKYVNGSVRPFVQKWARPKEYVGVDIESGKFVDRIVPAGKLVANFGSASFDCVISTELIEHVRDWRIAVNNVKEVLKPGGLLYLSTRSVGFRYHAHPHDYWRFSIEDALQIFRDFYIITLEKDEEAPGIFLKARKPIEWKPADLLGVKPYSMVLGTKTESVLEHIDMPLSRKARAFIQTRWEALGVFVSPLLELT